MLSYPMLILFSVAENFCTCFYAVDYLPGIPEWSVEKREKSVAFPTLGRVRRLLMCRHGKRRCNMNVTNVDSLLAQMRAAVAVAQGQVPQAPASTGAASFSNVLKSSLDGVNQAQHQAKEMQRAFVLGDDKVSLSDTMIAMQKANISFQTTVQVRNRMVAAYNDIMNMQV
jgi:flagellar hook-basal body complex protein FliE